jgi:hypothetical protein
VSTLTPPGEQFLREHSEVTEVRPVLVLGDVANAYLTFLATAKGALAGT